MYKTGSKFNIKTAAGEFAEIIGVYPGGQQKPKTEYKIIYAGAVFIIEESFLKLIFNEIEIEDPILSVFTDLKKDEKEKTTDTWELAEPVFEGAKEVEDNEDSGAELDSRDMGSYSEDSELVNVQTIDDKSGGPRRGRPRQS
jgi:hypothetical protein